MSTRNFVFAVLLSAAGMSATVSPATAEASVSADLSINIAPPAPRYEVAQPERVGYVWVPGYWNWHRHRHVWVAGNWVRARHGHHYYPHRWESRQGGWYLNRGRWDRDGDRVPDYRDRRPNNPNRR